MKKSIYTLKEDAENLEILFPFQLLYFLECLFMTFFILVMFCMNVLWVFSEYHVVSASCSKKTNKCVFIERDFPILKKEYILQSESVKIAAVGLAGCQIGRCTHYLLLDTNDGPKELYRGVFGGIHDFDYLCSVSAQINHYIRDPNISNLNIQENKDMRRINYYGIGGASSFLYILGLLVQLLVTKINFASAKININKDAHNVELIINGFRYRKHQFQPDEISELKIVRTTLLSEKGSCVLKLILKNNSSMVASPYYPNKPVFIEQLENIISRINSL